MRYSFHISHPHNTTMMCCDDDIYINTNILINITTCTTHSGVWGACVDIYILQEPRVWI